MTECRSLKHSIGPIILPEAKDIKRIEVTVPKGIVATDFKKRVIEDRDTINKVTGFFRPRNNDWHMPQPWIDTAIPRLYIGIYTGHETLSSGGFTKEAYDRGSVVPVVSIHVYDRSISARYDPDHDQVRLRQFSQRDHDELISLLGIKDMIK